MKEPRPDEWRGAFAREFQEQSAARFEKIGKQLQFKLARITAEPLPAELHELLKKEKALD